MKRTAFFAGAVLPALILALAASAAAQSEVIWGTVTAVRSYDPGFEGYWKYCLTITWDVTKYGGKPHGVSHISVVPELEACRYVCDQGYFMFPDTAGSSMGASGCAAYYYGEFNCKGDPSTSLNIPTLKFEPYVPGCKPGIGGTAYLCFYSPIGPRPTNTYPGAIWIKFGLNVTYGTLTGMLPNCGSPSVANEASTWGAIKALFGP